MPFFSVGRLINCQFECASKAEPEAQLATPRVSEGSDSEEKETTSLYQVWSQKRNILCCEIHVVKIVCKMKFFRNYYTTQILSHPKIFYFNLALNRPKKSSWPIGLMAQKHPDGDLVSL